MTTLLQAPQIMSTIAYIYHDTLTYQNIMAMADGRGAEGDRIPECHRPAAEERQVLHPFLNRQAELFLFFTEAGTQTQTKIWIENRKCRQHQHVFFGFHFDENIFTISVVQTKVYSIFKRQIKHYIGGYDMSYYHYTLHHT